MVQSFTADSAIILTHDDSGTLHHFRLALTDLTLGVRANGQPDPALLRTPQMVCTDSGCGYTCHSYFPRSGGLDAQRIHARYLLATGQQPDLLAAARAIAETVDTDGGRAYDATTLISAGSA